MVNEVNVLRSSFSAQYGLAQGVVTYQTASGTNQLHGDVFEILRNNFFDARGAYNPTVPVDNENNYGFTVGRPGLASQNLQRQEPFVLPCQHGMVSPELPGFDFHVPAHRR